MSVKVKFTPSRPGILLAARSDGVYRDLERRMDNVFIAAEATAPVDTGQYAFGTVKPGGFVRKRLRPRGGAAVRGTATAPHSIYVEFGNRLGAPARHTLRNALLAAAGKQ